jgi:hypothetical protein
MDGFQWTLKGGASCINLYFPGWTLNTQGKMIGAMVGVFFLAMVTEAISKMRHNLSREARLLSTSQAKRKQILAGQMALHGIHALTGYIVMLATMTFSLELLLCVISGLTVGYVMFGGESYNHVSTNPCCAFLEEEAQERASSEEFGGDGQVESPNNVESNCCESRSDVENVTDNPSEGSAT